MVAVIEEEWLPLLERVRYDRLLRGNDSMEDMK